MRVEKEIGREGKREGKKEKGDREEEKISFLDRRRFIFLIVKMRRFGFV